MIVLKNNPYQKISRKIFRMIIYATFILEQNKVIAASLPESTTSSSIIDNNILQNVYNEICNTPICQQEAAFYLNLMNQEVDPCDDFYQFSCGNFIKNADIPKDSNRFAVIESVQKEIDHQLLTELQNQKPDDSTTFKKIKALYRNCVREPEQESIQFILDALSKFGGMPLLQGEKWNEESFDWLDSTLKLYDFGVPPTFPAVFVAIPDQRNTSKNLLNIFSARTRVSYKFFMNQSDKKLLEAYRHFMIDIMVMLGANKSMAIQQMTDCLDFEIKLYRIKTPAKYLRNSSATFNPMTIKQVSELCPVVPWLDYLNQMYNSINVTFDENEIIVVKDPAAINKLGKLISETPKKLLANYIMWQMIFELIDFLPEKFLDRIQAFQAITEGIKERKTRTMSCTDFTVNSVSLAINALYVQKFINKGSRESATAMVQTMKSHFGKMLKENDWMDEKTKRSAIEKLEAMNFFVGYYPEFFDNEKIDKFYKDVNITDGNFLVSALNLSQFNKMSQLQQLRNPTIKTKYSWTRSIASAIINAYYIGFLNEMDIAASLLQQPFYHLERPQYLNYGVLGQVIGHEITHGFDNEGRKLDKRGNKVDWWEPSTQQQYIEKSKCFIDKYSNYTVAEVGLRINGEQTLRENIADFGGFKVAYGAYVDWVNRNNITEPQLPGLNYTPRQMYWISLASFYCGKFNKEFLINKVVQNAHSPREARVILTLSNLPEFAEDFACKPNTKMNPVDKCNLW